MKKIKILIYTSLLTTILFFSGCSDFLNVNDDPNRVSEENVTAQLLFPQTQAAYARRLAQRFAFMNRWMGYWGAAGNFVVNQDETTYKLPATFTDNNWANAYDILFDMHLTETKALENNQDRYMAGAVGILSVKLWQELVDLYGDVPYTQKFQNLTYPTPKYDKAQDIYKDLFVRLDSSLVRLKAKPLRNYSRVDIMFSRGNDDMLDYSTTMYKKLANTIRLRLLLRQSNIISPAEVTAQLAKITPEGFLMEGENVSVNPGYTNSVDKQSPFYESYGKTPSGSDASTYDKANNYFVNVVLDTKTDPRTLRFFASPASGTDYGALNGNVTDPQTQNIGSNIGPGLAGSAAQNAWILPAFESLFLQAEAAQRGWIKTEPADSLYRKAIRQNFIFLSVENAVEKANEYIANNLIDANDPINQIIYQKYIALCGIDPQEAWSDLRRIGGGTSIMLNSEPTGYLSNNVNRAVHLPYVLVYPQNEITTNSANVKQRDVFSYKIFWQP